jgi:hypothetical protein
MSSRSLVTFISILLCLGGLWAVLGQRQRIQTLRANQRTLGSVESQDTPTSIAPQAPEEPALADAGQAELLRLRGQVTRLNARKRELASVVAENERLKTQSAVKETSRVVAPLPAGYIRLAESANVGCHTPEDTLQSFFWAVKKGDVSALQQVFTPAGFDTFQRQLQQSDLSMDRFFQESGNLPGFALRSRRELADGLVEVEIEIAPGIPANRARLERVNGIWKLSGPF